MRCVEFSRLALFFLANGQETLAFIRDNYPRQFILFGAVINNSNENVPEELFSQLTSRFDMFLKRKFLKHEEYAFCPFWQGKTLKNAESCMGGGGTAWAKLYKEKLAKKVSKAFHICFVL